MNNLLVWGGALVGMGWLVAVHLLTFRRPDPQVLPTARFVPDAPVRQLSRQRRLSDVALLALRCVAIAVLAAVIAPPDVSPPRSGVARVVLLDVSRGARQMNTDSLIRAEANAARTMSVVLFSNTAIVGDDGAARPDTAERGNLSAGLVAAMREGYRLAPRHDSVELVVVSPLLAEELDAGTEQIAQGWPGSLRLRRVPPALDSVVPEMRRVEHQLDATDAAGAASLVAFGTQQPRSIRVVRSVGRADSLFADGGGIVVAWPNNPKDSVRVRAVISERTSFIAPLGREPIKGVGDVLAWWGDGEQAIVEERLGRGCIRWVGLEPPQLGDVPLRPGMTALLRYMSARCGMRDPALARDSAVSFLTRTSLPAERGANAAPPPWLVRALLLVAIALLLIEFAMRRDVVMSSVRATP